MSWKDLLQVENETVTVPWLGGRRVQLKERSWDMVGKKPPEWGWHTFRVEGRKTSYQGSSDPLPDLLYKPIKGYLIGNRLVPDQIQVSTDPKILAKQAKEVFLIEPGIDKFARISAGYAFEGGPLIYKSLEFPLGPEEEVSNVFLDHGSDVTSIKGVVPALDAAFRFETWQREETERRRIEAEKTRLEEEARRAQEERRRLLAEQLGTGEGRRAMAKVNFAEAARSALAIGGAVYLDHRTTYQKGEAAVKFRYMDRRFECVCDMETLRIIDAGICLTDHDSGEKGDTYFSLESLPSVIKEAIDLDVLVIFRHV